MAKMSLGRIRWRCYHGSLKLYTHHITTPSAPDGRPEYNMTQVRSRRMAMTGNMDDFRRGATAFRNFIQGANARASQARTAASQADAAEQNEDEISTPCEHQHIADASLYDLEDASEAPVVPHYPYKEDDSQEASQEPVASGDDPSMSFTSSSHRALAVPNI
ncbi:hypothetical protein ACHAQJ_009325 [Trichoderma viride]